MSFTHKRLLRYYTSLDEISNTTEAIVGDAEVGFDGSIAPSGTNIEIDIAFAVTGELKSLLIYSSQALTVKSNSSGAPDNTLSIAAGWSLVWNSNDIAACPFTVDVTKLFVTNASSTLASTVKIRALTDSTP